MKQGSIPDPAGLICAILAVDEEALVRGKERMAQRFAEVILESETFSFTYTTYYAREMGTGLIKQFVGFQELVQKDRLAQIKLETIRMEGELGKNSPEGLKRKVNLDPGYLTLAKVVLATTKNRDHRIYLTEGIFAEITLRYVRGRFKPQEWTYPDYQSEQAMRFFRQMREYISGALDKRTRT